MQSAKENLDALLQEVIARHRPPLVGVVRGVRDLVALTQQQLSDLSEALSDELCSTGFKEDDEPNQRGLALESLIDEMMRTSRKKN